MSRPMSDHQLKVKRVEFFSSEFRRLSGADQYVGDMHGAHAEANRSADRLMAKFLVDQDGLVANAEAEPEQTFSWDDIMPTKAGDPVSPGARERPAPAQLGAVDWDEIFAERKSSTYGAKAEIAPRPDTKK